MLLGIVIVSGLLLGVCIAKSVLLKYIKHRTATDSQTTFELDDLEIVSLLSKSEEAMSERKSKPLQLDHTFEEQTIRCSKCGFTNPASATVCRDCNSLLRGNEFFSVSSRKMYSFVCF